MVNSYQFSFSFLSCCLTINKGEVETMCEINLPINVVVTENNTILVSSEDNKVYKIIHQGIIAFVQDLICVSLSDLFCKEHKTTKCRILQGLGHVQVWMEELMNAALLIPMDW
jgi:hypothetical protein